MNSEKIKITAALLAVVLLLSLLSACGDVTYEPTVEPDVTTQNKEQEKKPTTGVIPPRTEPVGDNGRDENPTVGTADIELGDMDFSFSSRDERYTYSRSDITGKINLTDKGISVSGKGLRVENNTVTVIGEGEYLVSGSSASASIVVSADKQDKVRLIFDGVSITNPDGAAVFVQSADKVFITLPGGTENFVSDGSDYVQTDGDTEIDAAIFSREDITVNGEGTLTVNGNKKHAIASSDDLLILGATLNITSKNVGIKGKDCVKIKNADITVNAGTDALRSDNEEDSSRGFIYIHSGSLTLTAENDGIQAHTLLRVDGGTLDVTTGGGSKNASTTSGGGFNFGWGAFGGGMGGGSASTDTESAKALKSSGYIVINDGNIKIDSSDDSIHSNKNVEINGGSITLSSGDDGMHADSVCTVNGGNIIIAKSYEGIEGSEVIINDGNIDITASDDGLNAAGGNDSSALGTRPGKGMFSSGVGKIEINGGFVLINSTGDGIDSNNTLDVSGGITLVSGPTSSGNSAFDHDGSSHISGGILIALGSSSMAQSFNTAENQGAILVTFSSQGAGTAISICDENGSVIASFTPKKAYNCAVITAPEIQAGKTYYIYSGATVVGADENGFVAGSNQTGGSLLATVQMSSLLFGGPGGMGGMGGRPK